MVKGVLYSTAGTRRAVVALDAATGEQLWMHSENEGARGAAAPRQLSGRGLAYWSDGKEERILYVTPGYTLVALDAKTGNRIPSFGVNGIVDLKQNMDQTIDPMSGEIGLHATPVVARNVVIVGAAHRSGGVPTGKTNVKGYIRGFDVRTGKRLWIFHTIPEPGEFGNETWDKDSWVYTGNAGVWAQMSVDEQLGLAYLPVESPTGDYGVRVPATDCLARRWLPSICRPANASGTTSSCTTGSGTWTFPAPRSFWTSPSTARRSRPSRSRRSRRSSTSSTARPASRSGRLWRDRSKRGLCPVSGIRRRSRSRRNRGLTRRRGSSSTT